MNTTVITDENQPTTQATTTQPATAAVDVAALQAELAAAKGQLTEAQRNSEFWFNRASTAVPAREQETVNEPEDDDTDVLDVLTTQGAKGLDSLLSKRGYVRAAEVDARVNAKASQLVQEQQIVKEYPDLEDHNSDFFKQTALNYRELKSQGIAESTAMRLAAQQTELQGFKSGKRTAPTVNREQQRIARIAAQSGETNNRVQEGSEADDELTDGERYICKQMGITEEAYKARAQKGIQMGGLNRGGVAPQRGGNGQFKKAA